jgi:hypothetical protein
VGPIRKPSVDEDRLRLLVESRGKRSIDNMKRTKILGLCLVAVFAMSALVAASASAGTPPEFKVCGKATKVGKLYVGKYTEKTCAKEASGAEIKEGKKNKYERLEYKLAKKLGFKAKNKGNPHNNIVNPLDEPGKIEGTTECTKEAVVGTVTGPKTETWKTIYTHCEAEKAPCNTKGAKTGEIKTEELEATLVFLNKAKTEPGLRVKGKGKEGELAQYECDSGGLDVNVYGEVLAKVKGNTNTANKKTTTEVKEGPLAMQSNLFLEESNTEAEGKQYFVWGYAYKACIKEELEKGVPLATAEAACVGKAGGFWKAYPNVPITLISKITGLKEAEAPATQNGVTETTGEAFLIET